MKKKKWKWDVEAVLIDVLGVISIIALFISIFSVGTIDKLEKRIEGIPSKNITLESVLSENGYETGCIKYTKQLVTRFNITCKKDDGWYWNIGELSGDETIYNKISEKIECDYYAHKIIKHQAIVVEVNKDCIQWGLVKKKVVQDLLTTYWG